MIASQGTSDLQAAHVVSFSNRQKMKEKLINPIDIEPQEFPRKNHSSYQALQDFGGRLREDRLTRYKVRAWRMTESVHLRNSTFTKACSVAFEKVDNKACFDLPMILWHSCSFMVVTAER